LEKILIFNTSFFDISQTFIYHQAVSLAGEYEVHLIASNFLNPHNFSTEYFEQFHVRRINGLMDRFVSKVFNKKLFNLESHRKLNQLFKKNHYRAVHAHFGTKALEILPYTQRHQVPLVVSFHGADASRMLKFDSYRKKLPALFDYASAIIISSKHMFDNLQLDRWSEKVRLIPYGVNPDHFSYSNGKEINQKNKNIKILHSGRFVGKKGVPDLIRVFHELSDSYSNLELNLIGDGSEINKCKQLVREFGLTDRVHFFGAVTHDEVKNQMQDADIFVLNSRIGEDGDMEGTPVTLLEAMCMGKAVVSTRHAGIPYVIDHGRNGLLADEKSNVELRDNLELLIQNSNLRQTLGKEAKDTIDHNYTIDMMKDKIRNVFADI
jgi:colanic acid/amylovoran biosynthesis glycosyltransferase